MIKHKYHMKRRLVLLALGFSLLISVNTAAADSANLKIEPFMAVPFGATKDDVMRIEGQTEESISSFYYSKTIMDIPVRVSYSFESKWPDFSVPDDPNDPSKYDSLRSVSVNFTKTGLAFEDAQKLSSEIIGLVKAQMQNPVVISKQYEREPIEDNAVNDMVFVTKEYLKDENVITSLVFWWYPKDSVLVATLEFCDAKTDYYTTQKLGYLFEPGRLATDLLGSEPKFPLVYNWNMTLKEFKAANGMPVKEFEDPENASQKLVYNKPFLGIPSETRISFERSGKFFSTMNLHSFDINVLVSCASRAEAEAVMLKITEFLAAEISSTRGVGYSLPTGYTQERYPKVPGFTYLMAPEANVSIIFDWYEENEQLLALISISNEILDDEDYANKLQRAKLSHCHIFYDVNGD